MNVSLRSATAKDFSSIQRIAYETWPITFGQILSEEQIVYMLETMYSTESLIEQFGKNHQFLIVSDGKDDVGFASYEINYCGLRKTKIHKIYILPSAQNSGIGKWFISKIGVIAKDNQNCILSLNVNRGNSALKFYQKVGFEKIREEDIDIGYGFFMKDFILEKILD